METAEIGLLECGHAPSEHESPRTGYGVADDGDRYCYECCAERDRAQMEKDGRITLYLIRKETRGERRYEVTNWPGSLIFPVHSVSVGRHNWAGTQTTAYFRLEGREWIARQYGDGNEVAHCRRLKG